MAKAALWSVTDAEARLLGGSRADRALQLSILDAASEGHAATIYAGKLATAYSSANTSVIQSVGDAGLLATRAMTATAELAMSLAPLSRIVNTKQLTVRDPEVFGGERTYVPATKLDYVTAMAYDAVVRRELDKKLDPDLRALQQLAAQGEEPADFQA